MVMPWLKPSVLVIDDHPANRLAYEAVLQCDYSVVPTDSSLRALELTQEAEFDVILLEARMPGMEGYELALELRKRELTRATPIIFISAVDQAPALVNRGYVAGATDYIFSPVDPDLLRFKVAIYCQMSLGQRALRTQTGWVADFLRALRTRMQVNGSSEDVQRSVVHQLDGAIAELCRHSSIT
jgi:response regulator RpfG family c-di-GMP phosphodiesterase